MTRDHFRDKITKRLIVRWHFCQKKAIKKAPGRTRTGDLRITNALLYQLSHRSLIYVKCFTQRILYTIFFNFASIIFKIFKKEEIWENE